MKVAGKIIPGYGVASGKGNDSRYEGGTLQIQDPFFRERGLDLSPYYMGTLNVDIAPMTYAIGTPKHFIKEVAWSEHIPPENFYFFDVSLHMGEETYAGLIYMPDPKTKADHVQKPTVLELLMPKIANLNYGTAVYMEIPENQLSINLED